MNMVAITGRLTRDADIRTFEGSDNKIANMSLAVQREYKGADGKYGTDFIDVVAFGKAVGFIERFGKKGVKFEISGSLRQDKWTDKTGATRTRMVVSVSKISFAESKSGSSEGGKPSDNGFMDIPDISDDEVPFV